MQDTRDLGLAPIVELDSIPTTLKAKFDIVIDGRVLNMLPHKALQAASSFEEIESGVGER